MRITIKNLADELGVSKQAVYKRAVGKLRDVLAPHTYMEYNRTFYDETGADIIRKDFLENPCATVVDDFRTNPFRSTPHTEHIQPIHGVHTECSAPNCSIEEQQTATSDTSTENTNTEQIRTTYGAYTEQSDNPSNNNTPSHIAPHMEHIQTTYGAYTDIQQKNEELQSELDAKRAELHQKELDLVKATSEREKLEAIIAQLNQRIADKDAHITEQRLTIEKTEGERRILTASLLRNNEFIKRLIQLPFSKRLFKWNEVKRMLTDTQNDIADDIAGETVVGVSVDDSDNDSDDNI